MRKEFLVFGKPFIAEDEKQEVLACMESGWLGRGPRVGQFEEDFAKYCHVPFAAAVSSCTAGLHLSMLALGIGEGAEVLVPALTFAATANSVIHAGAVPVFVDVDPETGCIDLGEMEKKITPKTRAIVPVHLHGRPIDMERLMSVAKKHNLWVIEDAAHAIESWVGNKKVGTIGHLGVFSFYSTKNITTVEGGMVISHNRELIDKVKVLCSHGLSSDAWKRYSDAGFKHYLVQEAGFKYNLTDFQAAIGIKQLQKIGQFYERRQTLWKLYQEKLRAKNLPLDLPLDPEPGTVHALHLYAPRVKAPHSRDQVMEKLRQINIGSGVHYLSLAEHPYYQKTFGYKPEHFPNALDFGRRTISLPFTQYLVEQDLDDVVDALTKVLS